MNAIEARALHKRYGDTVALENLDLDVPCGALFGLLGPNGAGKTTTFSIMCGWRRPTRGRATVLGTQCSELHRLRGRVAALPQDAAMPAQITVFDQLVHFSRLMGMGAARARAEAEQALEKVGLTEARATRGLELSHGMNKRVGIAQALLGAPEVILLDEPTAGLDPKSARQVKDLLRSLVPAATVVFASHNLVDVQEICTHGAILDHGRLVQQGTLHDLTRRSAEVNIELASTERVPLAALRARFGDDGVQVTHADLSIRFAPDQEVSEVIRDALQILLQADAPILGLRRGTSLERAYLNAILEHEAES